MRVALATSETWPSLSPDDQDLLRELAERGADAIPAVWSDRTIEWSSFQAVVIRSCWDYHLRLDEFLHWTESLPVPVHNAPAVVRWNSHKSYLEKAAASGVPVPRTNILAKGSKAASKEPGRVIVKPAVSASAYETHLCDARDADAHIQRLLASGDVIVQEYIPEVVTNGEWSLIYFDRQFSHAVKKEPKEGDFRVQQELGGTAVPAAPPERVRDAAERALALVSAPLLYARIDLVERDRDVLLMELELIEPSLFLRTSPGSSRRFAAAIVRAAG